MNASIILEGWDQDIFGMGLATETSFEFHLSQYIGLMFNAGYKTKGYVMGKQIAEGFNGGVGMVFKTNY